jgi:type II secretory ATPase GspE/PulE/Tfp pilus assembly ATPase PilB-like protein
LLRKLCPDCKEAYELTPEQKKNTHLKTDLVYKAKGCPRCNQLGYRGRTCIAEVMAVNEPLQELINQGAAYQKIKDLAKAAGMQTLYESALRKAEAGITSLEEALSVTLGAD